MQISTNYNLIAFALYFCFKPKCVFVSKMIVHFLCVEAAPQFRISTENWSRFTNTVHFTVNENGAMRRYDESRNIIVKLTTRNYVCTNRKTPFTTHEYVYAHVKVPATNDGVTIACTYFSRKVQRNFLQALLWHNKKPKLAADTAHCNAPQESETQPASCVSVECVRKLSWMSCVSMALPKCSSSASNARECGNNEPSLHIKRVQLRPAPPQYIYSCRQPPHCRAYNNDVSELDNCILHIVAFCTVHGVL